MKFNVEMLWQSIKTSACESTETVRICKGLLKELRVKLEECGKLEKTWGEPTAEGEMLRELLGDPHK